MDHIALAILIAVSADQQGASMLFEKGTNKLVIEMIEKSATNERRANYWFMEKSKESKALVYLNRISQYPESAGQLKNLGAIGVLSKIMGIGQQIAIDAALSIIFIETLSSYDESFAFPPIQPPGRYKTFESFLEHIIAGIATALDLTSRELNGTNFTYGKLCYSTLLCLVGAESAIP